MHAVEAGPCHVFWLRNLKTWDYEFPNAVRNGRVKGYDRVMIGFRGNAVRNDRV
jgi:hypothetical protein